jgi:flagellar protein FlaG
MAETGFNPSSVVVVPTSDSRDKISDRVQSDAQRVQPVEKQDGTSLRRKPAEETAAEIEQLADGAFKNSRLSITRDTSSKDFIYMMVDQDTGEAVRRWPPETHSELLEYLRTQTAGLINQRA